MIVLPLVLAIPLCIDLFHVERAIFPAREFGNRIHTYTDRWANGRSTVDKFYVGSTILTLEYTLHEGARYPMVFFSVLLDSNGKACDLSRYDRVSIRIREATNRRILIYIKTFMEGVSRSGGENAGTLRHNEYTLSINPEIHEYEIGLDEFITSPWWIDARKIDPYRIPVERFDRIMSFDFQFNTQGSVYKTDRPEKISIEKISFKRPPALFAVVPACVMCAYYAVFAVLAFLSRLRRKVAAKLQIPEQQQLVVTTIREEQLQRINTFLKAHYNDPDISTRMIYTTLGIPSARVFNLLKGSYGLSFKQIINTMRIEEAKRLLLESDLPITEIAMRLGFNDLSYFSQLFKKHEGVTPSEFRG
jgi:AraC-like DNA-binding protein